MFGKQAIRNIIRQNAAASAGDIHGRSLRAPDLFRGTREAEDDITLVVVKRQEHITHDCRLQSKTRI
jgi:serine phosphatase RsbU (regulator of sigma subunit)